MLIAIQNQPDRQKYEEFIEARIIFGYAQTVNP